MELHLLLTAWTFDPITLIGLALLLGGYFYAVGPLRRRLLAAPPPAALPTQTVLFDEPLAEAALANAAESALLTQFALPRRKVVYFVSGWALLAFTLISPLDVLGREYLFSAHTAQLFLIITAVAPLLMLGIPDWLTGLLLPSRAIRQATEGLLFQVVAVVLFNGIILAWHITPFYEAALHNMPLHDFQMFCFLVAGVLTYWPLLTPTTRRIRMSSPIQIVYLAAESIPLDIFGVFTLFTTGIFYHTYEIAPRLWGFSAAADQQLGGAILAVPGSILDVILMSIIFFGWINQMERAQIAREHALYDAADAEAAADAAVGAERAKTLGG